MSCKNCEIKPVYKTLTNIKLCKNCFIKYFENKVFKTISKYKLLQNNKKVVVAVSGGKDSITTLYLLNKYSKKLRNVEIEALAVDEGIKNYREKTLDFLKKFCKENKIKLKIISFKEFTNKNLDEIVEQFKKEKRNLSPCNICGTFRRYLLNKYSKEMKADLIATGHNLDDEDQNILLNMFKNNLDILLRLGPKTEKIEGFVQKIKPLYFMTEKEVRLYVILKGFDTPFTECPYSKDSFREDIGNMLNNLEDKHKGIKTGLLNFYLNLKKELEIVKEDINNCKICGEISQKEICNTCKLKEIININKNKLKRN